jgi:hypothetical protein
MYMYIYMIYMRPLERSACCRCHMHVKIILVNVCMYTNVYVYIGTYMYDALRTFIMLSMLHVHVNIIRAP